MGQTIIRAIAGLLIRHTAIARMIGDKVGESATEAIAGRRIRPQMILTQLIIGAITAIGDRMSAREELESQTIASSAIALMKEPDSITGQAIIGSGRRSRRPQMCTEWKYIGAIAAI